MRSTNLAQNRRDVGRPQVAMHSQLPHFLAVTRGEMLRRKRPFCVFERKGGLRGNVRWSF